MDDDDQLTMNSAAESMALAKVNTAEASDSSGLVDRPDWQIGCSELKQRGGHLLQTAQWADCTFLVGEEPHVISIKAHRLILASASPVFEAMFFGGMAEGDGPIRIPDVQPDAFKLVLLYIYTDNAVIPSFDRACSIHYIAKKYMLPYLEKKCSWFISLNLDTQNVCRAYELAQLFDDKLLMEKSLKIMESQTKEILVHDSFLDIDINTLNTLLSLDHLTIESELDLFNAIERYAKAHFKIGQNKRRHEIELDCSCDCFMSTKRTKSDSGKGESANIGSDKRNSILNGSSSSADTSMEPHKETGEMVAKKKDETPLLPLASSTQIETDSASVLCGDDDDSTMSNLFETQNESSTASQVTLDSSEIIEGSWRTALGRVRFLTLSARQFARGPARSALLSRAQAFALLLHILAPDSPLPLPAGFSTSREPRNQQTIAPELADAKSEAVFRFTVLNFKTRRRSVESRPFTLHDVPWTLRLVPRFETNTAYSEQKYFSLYLKCNAKKENAFMFKVKADLRLLAQQPQKPDVFVEIEEVFTNALPEFGVERMVEWQTALSAERGLLRNNALAVQARVLATKLPR